MALWRLLSVSNTLSIFRTTSLILAVALPFLVPFSPTKNIDAQGLVVLIAGAFAWLSLIGSYSFRSKRAERGPLLIALFLILSVVSLIVSPHKDYGLLGAPSVRIGILAFIAFTGISIATSRIRRDRLLIYLYSATAAIALLSVPYSLVHFDTLARAGGLFSQADVLACAIGVSIMLGQELLKHGASFKRIIAGGQILLIALLVLTGTRAVILVVVLFLLLQTYRYRTSRLQILWHLALVFVLLGTMLTFLPERYTDTSDTSASISYRRELQVAALHASFKKPFLGYGPGNVADALDCKKLAAPALQGSCDHGFFFNSSHNIFLDRILMVGWPGGLAFLLFVLLALYKGFIKPETRLFASAALMISLYYLTNVTSVSLELLFWILLFSCLRPSRA